MISAIFLVSMILINPITSFPAERPQCGMSERLLQIPTISAVDQSPFTTEQINRLNDIRAANAKQMNPRVYGFLDRPAGKQYPQGLSPETTFSTAFITSFKTLVSRTRQEKRAMPESASFKSWEIYQRYSYKVEAEQHNSSSNLKELASFVTLLTPEKFNPETGDLPQGVDTHTLSNLIVLSLDCLEGNLKDHERLWALGVLSCLNHAAKSDPVKDFHKGHFVRLGAMDLSYLKSKWALSEKYCEFMVLYQSVILIIFPRIDVQLAEECRSCSNDSYETPGCESEACLYYTYASILSRPYF